MKKLAYYEITLPSATLPGAKLLKKFDQNFCLFRSENQKRRPAAKRLRGWVRRTLAEGKILW